MTVTVEALLEFLKDMPATQQLEFWQEFRAKHRTRTANGEAQLAPALLAAVDAQIATLKPLAAVERTNG